MFYCKCITLPVINTFIKGLHHPRFLGCFILPYSPRWLCSKERYDEGKANFSQKHTLLLFYSLASVIALQTLADLHAEGNKDDPYVRQEYDEIMAQVQFEKEKAVKSYVEIFRQPSTRKRVFLAAGIQCMQQWTGINAVLYYAPFIFESAGMTSTLSSLLATGVNGILCVIFTVPALLFIDKWGRRNTLLAGGAGMGISMLIAGSLLKGN